MTSSAFPPSHPVPPRRNALSLLLRGTLAVLMAPIAWVAFRYLRAPKSMPVSVAVGPVSSIPPGSARVIKVGAADGIVIHHPDGSLDAFNLRCTHAGCNVAWNQGAEQFYCPCHGGVFDSSGAVAKGPPKRGLEKLDVRLDRGIVKVTNS